MDVNLQQTRYEPLPRWGHVSVVIGNKLYLWGGRIEDFSEESKKELASVVEVFDFETELWEKKTTSGPPPPGLYNTAYTTIDHCLYVYGGWDGQLTYNNLHQLDVLTMTWTELKPAENSEIPMKMSGCGLVNYGKDKLVLFGGCGVPTEDSQQSSVPKSTSGTVSYTTVRSNEGSGVGASQEEEVRLLEVTSGQEVPVQAEVHSQPDSLPPAGGSLSEGVMDLYNLAVSQVDSQVSHHSLSQATSSQEEPTTTQPTETRTESQTNSSQGEAKSKGVGEESKAQPQSGDKEEAPAQAKEDDQASSLAQESKAESQPQENGEIQQSPKKEGDEVQSQAQEKGDEQTQEKGHEVQSQTQEKGDEVQSQFRENEQAQTQPQSQELKSEITTQPVPHENGEVKVQPAQLQENGVPESESQDEKKAESPSHSQDDRASKPSSPEKASAATATVPQSLQNGEIEAQPPAGKQEESKKPSEVEIQPQPQSKSQSQIQSQSQTQPAEEESEEESDDGSDVMDRRWTNELKVFDLKENVWTTPVAHGDFPPPCVDFSFTSVDNYRSVMYGGFQPEAGTSSEAYVLNMETWSWTKLTGSDSASDDVAWPVGRDGHASCLLAGTPNPQVLISGGWDKDNKLINDAWILNINERMWKELTMPVMVGARFWHSVSCYQFSRRMKQLLFFGGCPGAPEELISGGCWAKLAATVVLELGLMDPLLPGVSASRLSVADELSSPSDWVVLDATDHTQLGLPTKRLKERVLLAEYRAIRAESIAREVLKKLEKIDLHLMSATYPQVNESDTPIPPEPKEEEEETEKEERPFWEISKKDVELTGVDIGKGRWSIVREAIYRGDRVAARCLYSQIISEDNFKVFMECLDTAAKLRHTNLLPFIGAVLEGEPIIITELMPFNLKRVLDKKSQLLNHQIVGIALDVARALNFLHTTKPDPVIHGDLTSTSVLLEQGRGNSWRAKLSDFMTAKFFKQLIVLGVEFDQSGHDRRSMSPAGSGIKHSTAGSSGRSSRERRSRSSSIGSESEKINRKVSMITPPDILDPTNLTPKRDTYSYGLLLVEMCSGSAPQVISLPFLLESITWTEMNNLIRDCVELEPENRPSMDDILPKIAEMHQSLSIGHGPSRPAIKKTFV